MEAELRGLVSRESIEATFLPHLDLCYNSKSREYSSTGNSGEFF